MKSLRTLSPFHPHNTQKTCQHDEAGPLLKMLKPRLLRQHPFGFDLKGADSLAGLALARICNGDDAVDCGAANNGDCKDARENSLPWEQGTPTSIKAGLLPKGPFLG